MPPGQESERISVRAHETLGVGDNQNLVRTNVCRGRAVAARAYLVQLWVIEEVGPVGVSLHVPELKQLPQTQHQDVVTDLPERGETRNKSGGQQALLTL